MVLWWVTREKLSSIVHYLGGGWILCTPIIQSRKDSKWVHSLLWDEKMPQSSKVVTIPGVG
jgi:hypothetical protein